MLLSLRRHFDLVHAMTMAVALELEVLVAGNSPSSLPQQFRLVVATLPLAYRRRLPLATLVVRLLELLHDADPELALSPQPSVARLDALAESVRASGLAVELDVSGDPRQMPPGLDLSAFRIVQEALTNVLKHGGGTAQASVCVRYDAEALELSGQRRRPTIRSNYARGT